MLWEKILMLVRQWGGMVGRGLYLWVLAVGNNRVTWLSAGFFQDSITQFLVYSSIAQQKVMLLCLEQSSILLLSVILDWSVVAYAVIQV